METFAYKAAGSGGVESGTLQARSKAEAYQRLISRQLRPITIERAGEGGDVSALKKSNGAVEFTGRLSANELLLFTEELSELLDSGLQLDPALRVMESSKQSPNIAKASAFLRQEVRDGVSFSNALRRCGSGFSELFCSTVAAGEAAGALPKILKRQSEYLAVILDLRKRIVAALIYPSIVFTAGIVLMVIFMTFLLPQLTVLLGKTGKKLPLMTQLMIDTSDFITHYGIFVLAALVAIALGFFAWKRSPEGRAAWDQFKLRIPLIGGILTGKFLAEFCQTLATLLNNGVTLLNALTLFQHATGNVYLQKLLSAIVERVGEGASLAATLRSQPFFPGMLCDIVTVGEQSGDLAASLQRGAKRYDREFAHQIERLTAFIQPLTIFVVAIFVGVVAYSMITGILSSVASLRPQ